MKQSGILLAALLLCTLWLLCASARAEGAASLPLCTTREEVDRYPYRPQHILNGVGEIPG